MTKEKEVPKKKYPPKFTLSSIMKGMARTSPIDVFFHLLMAILLITGLIIDLLGPWLGGSLSTIRSIGHGYVGTLFILVFIVYIVGIALSKKMRMVLTVTNLVDFSIYIVLIVTGVAVASANAPWINIFPGLSEALLPIAQYSPVVHTTATYIWIIFSFISPSGILHGLACTYLIHYFRRKSKVRE